MFQHLTDLVLARVYKFLLKRTIGKYLEDELLLEQVCVESREGVVTLNDIRLKAEAINEELSSLVNPSTCPSFQVVSASLSSLSVYVSYSKLLTESCRFVADEINIVISPFTSYSSSRSDTNDEELSQESLHDNKILPNNSQDPPLSENSQQDTSPAVNLIAHWIEIMVAKLQLSINKVTISFTNQTNSIVPPLQCRLVFNSIKYFNSDMSEMVEGETSLSASTKMLSTGPIGSSKSKKDRKVTSHTLVSCLYLAI